MATLGWRQGLAGLTVSMGTVSVWDSVQFLELDRRL